MKARMNKSEAGHDSRVIGPRSCSTADRTDAVQPRITLRLTEIQPMTAAQQQRFELLFDALIAHWLARSETKEGKPND
jgi:hypothetical protein